MTNNKPITFITYIAFEQHNLFELCSVNKSTLANFLHFLDIGYHRNPYVSCSGLSHVAYLRLLFRNLTTD